jgi:hypothetical protein
MLTTRLIATASIGVALFLNTGTASADPARDPTSYQAGYSAGTMAASVGGPASSDQRLKASCSRLAEAVWEKGDPSLSVAPHQIERNDFADGCIDAVHNAFA